MEAKEWGQRNGGKGQIEQRQSALRWFFDASRLHRSGEAFVR